MKQKVIFIIGPTAAGKTDIALDLAEHFKGEIICADSMQIYQDMHIGTARPLYEEQRGIPHHLFGFIAPDAEYNVAKYQKDAKQILANLSIKGTLPLVVGGTGLYINSLLYNIDFTQTAPNQELRQELSNQYNLPGGPDKLYSELVKKDPVAALRIHPNDKKRLIRRLEILLLEEPSAALTYNFCTTMQESYESLIIGINKERELLYKDIEKRVDIMISQGLEEEVRKVYEHYGEKITAFSAIGYKEFLPYFHGIASKKETIELIKRNTRRFAKRQLTWFRKIPSVQWFLSEDFNDKQTEVKKIEDIIEKFLDDKCKE